MKLIIFAGTPGSGKTSIIKHVINLLKDDFNIGYIKFDCLKTSDDQVISEKYNIVSQKKLAEDLCPDHYTAFELSKIVQLDRDKDILLVETAGLCLRCSPYVKQGLAINVLDITAGNPDRYGPILTQADIVTVSKADLISQAEREIFRVNVLDTNPNAKIVESNGLTGEGALDLVEYIKEFNDMEDTNLTFRYSMPSGICAYCYSCKFVDFKSLQDKFDEAKKLKFLLPDLNCGKCGFKSCNEFIRSTLDNKVEKNKCPFVKMKLESNNKQDEKEKIKS